MAQIENSIAIIEPKYNQHMLTNATRVECPSANWSMDFNAFIRVISCHQAHTSHTKGER